MSLEDYKLGTFTNPVADMDNQPSQQGLTAQQVKEWFDSNTNEIKTAYNGLIDALSNGSGGGELIGSSNIRAMRLNENNELEVSTDGVTFTAVPFDGHVIVDTNGTVYTQRKRLMVAGEIEDTGTETFLHGITGPQGPAGPAGQAGSQGIQGPRGKVYIPSVSAAGVISWTISDTEATPAAVSIRGPQGVAGEPGPAGPQGEPGVAGPQGVQGLRGPAGPTGPTGPAGQDGADGADGQDGAPGPNLINTSTETTITGLLKGNGSAVSAAVSGTDYQAPLPAQTGQSGKFLTTNGTELSWDTPSGGGSAYTSNPEMDGTASPGTSSNYARGDHVHPSDASKLNLSGGTMTGPIVLSGAPTADLNPATKKYVDDICGDIATVLEAML